MKSLTNTAVALILSACVLLQSCATTQQLTGSSLTDLQITAGAEAGTIVALNMSKKATTLAPQAYVISTAIYSLSGGDTAPTAQQLQDRIALYTHGTELVAVTQPIVDGLTTVYKSWYDRQSGNLDVKQATFVLNDLALGVQKGCAVYMPTKVAVVWQHNQQEISLALTQWERWQAIAKRRNAH
jgi:hypothetical protein